VDSNTTLSAINTQLVIDTVYRDSSGVQDITYEYRVAAVDTFTTEGTRSAVVSVTIAAAFSVKDSIVIDSGATEIFYLGNKLYALNGDSKTVSVYDTASKQLFSTIPLAFSAAQPIHVVAGPSGSFFCLTDTPQVCYQINTAGDTIKSWIFNFGYVNEMAYFNDSLYILYHLFNDPYYNHAGKNIARFSISSDSFKVAQIDSAGYGMHKGLAVDMDHIYTASDDYSAGYSINILDKSTMTWKSVVVQTLVGQIVPHYRILVKGSYVYLLFSSNYLGWSSQNISERFTVLTTTGDIVTWLAFDKNRFVYDMAFDNNGTISCLFEAKHIIRYK
jgi:hypothetical protein